MQIIRLKITFTLCYNFYQTQLKPGNLIEFFNNLLGPHWADQPTYN